MRTKKQPKKKSKRTKKPILSSSNPSIYSPWGGYLFNPSSACPYRHRANDGGIWCDINICRYCKNPCPSYLSYIKLKPAERKEHLKKQGVKNQD